MDSTGNKRGHRKKLHVPLPFLINKSPRLLFQRRHACFQYLAHTFAEHQKTAAVSRRFVTVDHNQGVALEIIHISRRWINHQTRPADNQHIRAGYFINRVFNRIPVKHFLIKHHIRLDYAAAAGTMGNRTAKFHKFLHVVHSATLLADISAALNHAVQ